MSKTILIRRVAQMTPGDAMMGNRIELLGFVKNGFEGKLIVFVVAKKRIHASLGNFDFGGGDLPRNSIRGEVNKEGFLFFRNL